MPIFVYGCQTRFHFPRCRRERAGICVVMGFYIIQFGENDWLTGFFKACCYTNTPTLLKKISLGKVF